MKDILTQLSCTEFAARLASKEAVPGGGGASALCGALASALCAMAARLSARADAGPEALIARADLLRERLLSLIAEDAEGFAPLAAAYAVPKDAPGRAAALREATLAACRAPMEMLRCCAGLLRLLEELYPLCKRLLLSDLGCAALLGRAAMESAAMNVFVNTRTLPEADALPLEAEADALLAESLPRADALAGQVAAFLRKERAHG